MTSRPLLRAAVLSILSLILLNLAMVPWSHRLPYRRKLEFIRTAADPNIAFIGDSLLDGRIDSAALNQGAENSGITFRPVNSAFVSTLPPDHALLADYAIELHPGVHTMVIGVMDFLLTRDTRFRPMNLTGNHEIALFPYFPVALVSKVNDWNTLDRIDFQLLRWIPMVRHRMNVWQYVEVTRRALGKIGMPVEPETSLGRAADMVAFEAGSPQEFGQKAQSFLAQPDHFNRSYEQIFALARKNKIQVVLVVMPMPARHLNLFYTRDSWHQYLSKLQDVSGQRGFTLIDASRWMTNQADFADNVHLSAEGANIFSKRLGAQLTGLSRSKLVQQR